MKIEYLEIKDIKEFENNNRKTDNIDALVKSIKEFGFNAPILLGKGNVIIAGHQRLLAAKLIKMTKVPTIKIVGLSKDEEARLRVLDNKIASFSSWDMGKLKNELKVIVMTNTLDELDAFISSFGEDSTKIELKNEIITKESFDKAYSMSDKKKSNKIKRAMKFKTIECPKCKKTFNTQLK